MDILMKTEYTQLQDTLIRFFNATRLVLTETDKEKISIEELERSFAETGLMLCGGAILSIITGTKVNDLDFYAKTYESHDRALVLFEKLGFEKFLITNNAVTLKRKSTSSNKVWTVQLITRFVGTTPEEIFKTFDFTIIEAAYDFSHDFYATTAGAQLTGAFVFGGRFFQDVARRRLVYTGTSNYPICALYRTLKYQKRGYLLPGATVMHIALCILRLEITTYGELKEQLMGIDTLYLQGLLDSEAFEDGVPIDYGNFITAVFEKLAPDLELREEFHE